MQSESLYQDHLKASYRYDYMDKLIPYNYITLTLAYYSNFFYYWNKDLKKLSGGQFFVQTNAKLNVNNSAYSFKFQGVMAQMLNKKFCPNFSII
jgi:hypothetical protein